MGILIGLAVVLLLAKIFLPAILVKIGIVIAILVAVATIIVGICTAIHNRNSEKPEPVDLMDILGAIAFIAILIGFWQWV